jgi:hypothetical protein
MKPAMGKDEMELRSQFDFSKAVRGKFHERYTKGLRVNLLDEDRIGNDPFNTGVSSTREMGRQLFESQIRAAGLRCEEPERNEGFDYIVYGHTEQRVPYAVQLKTSANESFSLHKADVHTPQSIIAYVWRAKSPKEATIYALTYQEALRIIRDKGYMNTYSWQTLGGYSVTNAGSELKRMLEQFRMTPELWKSKLKTL